MGFGPRADCDRSLAWAVRVFSTSARWVCMDFMRGVLGRVFRAEIGLAGLELVEGVVHQVPSLVGHAGDDLDERLARQGRKRRFELLHLGLRRGEGRLVGRRSRSGFGQGLLQNGLLSACGDELGLDPGVAQPVLGVIELLLEQFRLLDEELVGPIGAAHPEVLDQDNVGPGLGDPLGQLGFAGQTLDVDHAGIDRRPDPGPRLELADRAVAVAFRVFERREDRRQPARRQAGPFGRTVIRRAENRLGAEPVDHLLGDRPALDELQDRVDLAFARLVERDGLAGGRRGVEGLPEIDMSSSVKISEITFDKSYYKPDEPVQIQVSIKSTLDQPVPVTARMVVTSLAATIGMEEQKIALANGRAKDQLYLSSPARDASWLRH